MITDLFNRLDFYISIIGVGLVLYLWVRRWWRRFTMSSNQRVRSSHLPSLDTIYSAVPPRETNYETEKPAYPMTPTPEQILSLQETAVADALARLILADELDLTKAVKIGAGKKSGAGYQKWSALVKASMDRQKQPQFLDETGERVAATYPVSGRR